jgi:16S rRNA (cytosine1402-N4)-methyltransferase
VEHRLVEHRPVLLAESLELLAVRPGGRYVDGTLGLGGHAAEILRHSGPDGRLLATDRDAEMLSRARHRLAEFSERVTFHQADFRAVPALLAGERVDGILLDLGISSAQLDDPDRGLSFQVEGPLDMRLDRSEGLTAEDLVNRMRERELADVIYLFGEEPASRRIARAIVAARPLHTTRELAEVVRRAAPRSRRPGLHPATRTFQALRIHVNRELEGLGEALRALARCLRPEGRMAVIAFHSLEDREAKQAFRALVPEGFRILTKKPVRPGEVELRENPRARSARLRGIERKEAA